MAVVIEEVDVEVRDETGRPTPCPAARSAGLDADAVRALLRRDAERVRRRRAD